MGKCLHKVWIRFNFGVELQREKNQSEFPSLLQRNKWSTSSWIRASKRGRERESVSKYCRTVQDRAKNFFSSLLPFHIPCSHLPPSWSSCLSLHSHFILFLPPFPLSSFPFPCSLTSFMTRLLTLHICMVVLSLFQTFKIFPIHWWCKWCTL